MSTSADAHAQATMFLGVNRPNDALRVLYAALVADPANARTLLLIAGAQLDAFPGVQGANGALDAASRCLAIVPDNAAAWRILSIAYLRLHDQPRAREAARRALELDPNDWRNFTAVVDIDSHTRSVSRDTKAAMREAMRLAPNSVGVEFSAALLATAMDRPRAAIAHYRRVLELAPGNSAAINNIATIRLRQGRIGEAAGSFVGMLAADPSSTLALANLRAAARVAFMLLILALLAVIAFADIPVEDPGSVGWPAGVTVWIPTATAVVATGIALAWVLWIRARSGAYFGRFVRSFASIDKPLVVFATLWVIADLGLFVAIFTDPRTTRHIYEGTIGGLVLLYLAFLISSLARGRRR